MSYKRIKLKGQEGLEITVDGVKVGGLYFSTAANVAAVETEFVATVPVGSTVIATSGIYFRDASGGTSSGWKTVTIS